MERFDPLTSFLSHLTCARCARRHDADELQSVCVDCSAPLLAEYDLEAAAQTVSPLVLAGRSFTLWRYEELLPVRNPAFRVTLGEGGTPLLAAASDSASSWACPTLRQNTKGSTQRAASRIAAWRWP